MRNSFTPEEVDLLALHLEKSEISEVPVAKVLLKLDDCQHGAGNWPEGWRPYCHSCGYIINFNEEMGTAFQKIYHSECVPSLEEPMPLANWLNKTRSGWV